MFSNTAIDVVIGLVFIYLLYSLLATVLTEIITTLIGLRARNLKEAVSRMLNDDDDKAGFWTRLANSFILINNPTNPIVEKFYNNPEIKYLGSQGIFKNPSSFKAESFSRTLLYELNGSGKLDKHNIENELSTLTKDKKAARSAALDQVQNESEEPAPTSDENTNPPNKGVIDNNIRTLDKNTAEYVLSLYQSSYGDLTKFKLLLEAWFDRTMEQSTEWYKRKVQLVLLILGFMIAWLFNADTFTIVHKLSNDKQAREQMVNMASAYVQNHPKISTMPVDTGETKEMVREYNNRLDSLMAVKKQLDNDIANANTILGSGAWLPHYVSVKTENGKKVYQPELDEAVFLDAMNCVTLSDGSYPITRGEKWNYFFMLVIPHFFGFFLTAIAISLGAPFWFDLLNKLMKLRTSAKQEIDSAKKNPVTGVSPLYREA